jgi:hypothetical protein
MDHVFTCVSLMLESLFEICCSVVRVERLSSVNTWGIVNCDDVTWLRNNEGRRDFVAVASVVSVADADEEDVK